MLGARPHEAGVWMLRYRRNAKGRTQKGTTKWHDDNTKPYDGGKPPALAALPASRAPRSETCSTYACLGASASTNFPNGSD